MCAGVCFWRPLRQTMTAATLEIKLADYELIFLVSLHIWLLDTLLTGVRFNVLAMLAFLLPFCFGSHSASVFIARDHLSLGLGVRCWVCADGGGEAGWADAMGRIKADQISQGAGAAWAPLILTACLQDVFLRPGLAFQQLLQFQGMRPVTYCLCNWCRFHKRK